MPTGRLHLTDSLLLEFDARLLGVGTFQGAPSLILDRTAFYPEAGGQLGDRGSICVPGMAPITVRDVQVDEAGMVHHLVESAPEGVVDQPVRGLVDRAHRRDSMSQHTAQHMLSRAFLDAAGIETISARLGRETSTIDLRTATLAQDVAAAVQRRVNDAVLEDRAVRVLFPTAEELGTLRLRKAPTVERDIRVVEIEGFDAMPCGGTHCVRTGQVGPVLIIGRERTKGLVRVTFLAGLRALRHLQEADAVVRDLAAGLTCTPAELGSSVVRLKEELKAKSQALGHARAALARMLASQLLVEHSPDASGTTWIFVDREDEDIDALRTLASALAQRSDVVAVVSSASRKSVDRIVVVDRGSAAAADAGKWVKALTTAHGGRGGGRPEHAEGRIPANIEWVRVQTPEGRIP